MNSLFDVCMSVQMHVYAYTCAIVPVSEDCTFLSFYCGDRTQVFGLGGKDLCLLRHLTLSTSFPFFLRYSFTG